MPIQPEYRPRGGNVKRPSIEATRPVLVSRRRGGPEAEQRQETQQQRDRSKQDRTERQVHRLHYWYKQLARSKVAASWARACSIDDAPSWIRTSGLSLRRGDLSSLDPAQECEIGSLERVCLGVTNGHSGTPGAKAVTNL